MRIKMDTPVSELYHSEDELLHYGVKGMKWGVRRYQRKDGSLTKLGRKRMANEASDYYKIEADKHQKATASRLHTINDILDSPKVNKMSIDDVDALFREMAAIEAKTRHLNARSDEIRKQSKLGKQFVDEYAKNVPVDKLLKAYSNEYAYYKYNIEGDKEWLLDWHGKDRPSFD